MSLVLYYSNQCNYCKKLLGIISKSSQAKTVHFICIDKREEKKNGETFIILESGQRLLLPPNITNVPALLLLHHGNRTVNGLKGILNYLRPQENEINNLATEMNGEPLAFSYSEMGNNLSDTYSYLNTAPEELLAKGNGGLRMKHNYVLVDENQPIATPPEDYVPNKVGSVDLSKVQAERDKDVTPNIRRM